MLRKLLLIAIRAYQASGGGRRWFGLDCHFEPSCSAYAHDAIHRFGLRAGGWLAFDRLRRCNRRGAVCFCYEPCPEALPRHA